MHYPDSRWRPRCQRKSRDDVSGRIRKDDTLVTERKRSNNKHMYKLEASRVN